MMKIGPLTRKAFISSSPILTTFTTMTSRNKHLPDWLSPTEQSLLEQTVNANEGISLDLLRRTDFQRIRDTIGDSCQVVLIGEATHGTEEFYQTRADITRSLLEHGNGFDAVLCEGDFPPFFTLNRFVGGAPTTRKLAPQRARKRVFSAVVKNEEEKEGTHVDASAITAPKTVDQAMAGFKDRFPDWMWLNNVMREFVAWLADFNRSRCAQYSCAKDKDRESPELRKLPVQLLGLDIYSMFRSADEVIDYLVDAGEIKMAQMARRRFSALDTFRPEAKNYGKAVHYDIVPSQADNIAKVLTSLYKQENRLYQMPGNGQELFNALQNAHVVAAAESYFRNLYEPGDVTWNLRDSSFLDTIKDVISYVERRKRELGGDGSQKARVIVWAHNSHVGDAKATSSASRGKYNLGQLCRQVFGKENVYIIGFSGNDGTVRAARRWGSPGEVRTLNPAFEGSHEYLLHLIAKARRQNAFGYTFRSNSPVAGSLELVDMAARELFNADRVERFVGVNYIPETELQSHYSVCNMSEQFDFVLHVDHSMALRTDEVPVGEVASESGRGKTNGQKWDMFLLDKHSEDYKDLVEKSVEEAGSG